MPASLEPQLDKRPVRVEVRKDGKPKVIELPDPTARQLVAIRRVVSEADDGLPTVLGLEGDALAKAVEERQDGIWGDDACYGNAFAQILELLTGEPYDLDTIGGDALAPQTCVRMLTTWMSPLGGPGVPGVTSTAGPSSASPSTNPASTTTETSS